MPFDNIKKIIDSYYTERLKTYGPVSKGVDWNSVADHFMRFDQLLKICDLGKPFSITDYGCGYGALVDYMIGKNYSFKYKGYDLSKEMICAAQKIHQDIDGCEFFTEESKLSKTDYIVANGIFNVRLNVDVDEWQEFVLNSLNQMAEIPEKGMAFNVLTKYSDPEKMRPDLYYADPCFYFDYCKRRFSKQVALLHDYYLYEFTILVRK